MSSTYFDWNLFNFLLPFFLFNSLFQTVAGISNGDLVRTSKVKSNEHMSLEWTTDILPLDLEQNVTLSLRCV